jgi:hypothetical protein
LIMGQIRKTIFSHPINLTGQDDPATSKPSASITAVSAPTQFSTDASVVTLHVSYLASPL